MDTWPAPTARAPVTATVPVPGSKSLTNRALVLAALSTRTTSGTSPTVRGALRSRDTDLMIAALRTLGVDIDGDDTDLRVGGALGAAAGTRIDCGLAGTVLRFVPPLAALGSQAVVFDGDEQARSRPIAPLLDAMRTLGIDIDGLDGAGLPFEVRGRGGVAGGRVVIDASASSQFVSGLLLAGASFTDGIDVEHVGPPLPSAPHIAMTVSMLRRAGVAVDDGTGDRWRVTPGPVSRRDWIVEPDLSNATPFLAAAAITGGTVRIPNWPATSDQPVEHVVKILSLVNATASVSDGHLEVRGSGSYGGFDVDLRAVGELTPTVAALAALAAPGSVSRLTGIAHLRGHETDRLAALSTELRRLGGRCTVADDGLTITAVPLHGGVWRSYADHRMATAGAILGLSVTGVRVDDVATTAKTLPEFPRMWAAMLAGGSGPADLDGPEEPGR